MTKRVFTYEPYRGEYYLSGEEVTLEEHQAELSRTGWQIESANQLSAASVRLQASVRDLREHVVVTYALMGRAR